LICSPPTRSPTIAGLGDFRGLQLLLEDNSLFSSNDLHYSRPTSVESYVIIIDVGEIPSHVSIYCLHRFTPGYIITFYSQKKKTIPTICTSINLIYRYCASPSMLSHTTTCSFYQLSSICAICFITRPLVHVICSLASMHHLPLHTIKHLKLHIWDNTRPCLVWEQQAQKHKGSYLPTCPALPLHMSHFTLSKSQKVSLSENGISR